MSHRVWGSPSEFVEEMTFRSGANHGRECSLRYLWISLSTSPDRVACQPSTSSSSSARIQHFIHSAIFDESTRSLRQGVSTKSLGPPPVGSPSTRESDLQNLTVSQPRGRTEKSIVYSNGHVDGKVIALRLVGNEGQVGGAG